MVFTIVIVGVIVLILALLWPRIIKKPTFTLYGSDVVTVAQGSEYIDDGATAAFKDEDLTYQIYVTDDVDTSQVGTYEVDYNIDRKFRTFTAVRTVEVTDQSAPEITLNGDPVVYVSDIEDYEDPGVTVTDNCDGEITEGISVAFDQLDDYTWDVIYTVSDSVGNEATAVREVQTQDVIPPEIVLNGDETIEIDKFTEFDDPGVTAIDDRDGDITDSVKVTGYVDIYRDDTYTLTYTATDSYGNESSVTRTVIVDPMPATEEHTIYLTFDDGPSTSITPQILDILKKNDIKATFFIVDYSEDKLPIIQRMIDEGHTIGIHGTSHDYSLIYSSVDAFMDSIDSLWQKLYDDTGYEAFVMRFPGGSVNQVSADYTPGIMTELCRLVTEQGWMYMDWNVSSGDANGDNIPVSTIVSNVEDELEEDRKNVVLMHDLSGKQTTANALQTIIDYGNQNGYTFCKITKDTVPIHQPVYN